MMSHGPPQRMLGSTGLQVSEIGLGAWAIGGRHYGPVDDEVARSTVRAYLEAGGNLIDTAPTYGDSERLLGESLEPVGDAAVVVSKTPHTARVDEIGSIREDLTGTLTQLGRDHVEVYMMHLPSPEPDVRDAVLDEFDALRDEGLVRHLGASISGPSVSEETVAMCDDYVATGRVEVIEIVVSPLRQLLVDRGVVSRAADAGVGVIVRTALESGFLSGRYPASHEFPDDDHRSRWTHTSRRAIDRAVAELEEICSQHPGGPSSLVELGIRFPLAYPGVSTIILGARSPEQVRQNLAYGQKGPLPDALQRRVEEWGRGRTLDFNPQPAAP